MKNLCDVIKYGGFLISYAAAQRPFFIRGQEEEIEISLVL